MKRNIAYILIILSIFVSGCSMKQVDYALDAASINTEYNFLMSRYEAINDIVKSKWGIIEETDKNKFTEIDTNVSMIKVKVDQFRSREFYNITPSDIGYIHTLAKDSYLVGKGLYVKYKSQLTTSEIITLNMYDESLIELDTMVTELIQDPDNADINSVLVKILSVAGTGLKLILPILI